MSMYRSCRNLANTIQTLLFQSAMARAAVGAAVALTRQCEHVADSPNEILLFADIPTVISASRQAQPIDFSPRSINIISDVLDDGRPATTSHIGDPGHDTHGRSVFGRLRMRF